MKKLIPLLILLVLAAGVWYMTSNSPTSVEGSKVASNTKAPPPPVPPVQVQQGGQGNASQAGGETGASADEGQDDDAAVDNRTAAEIYKNADDALAAVKRGAGEYDDLVLSQFTQPGEDCTWCETFYKSLRDLIAAPDAKPEQKSYYGEILAISGRLDNISALVDLVKNSKNPEEAEVFAESLELAQGKDDVVNYLGEQMKASDQTLKDAAISAVTNQGSRLAAELLYKEVLSSGDADGHYAKGIGLGELVPSEDALPYLQEVMQKRDQYSHLAVKALLNSGIGGLRIVMDALTNSKNPDFDKSMLKDAIDHVNYEDEIEQYAKKLVETSKQPLVVEFAKNILSDFATQAADSGDDASSDDSGDESEEAPMSKMPGT